MLAKAGLEVTVLEGHGAIGGGTRTSELTGDGTLHDHCSSVHPLGALSPALNELELTRHGVSWCAPEVDLAHPLDDGSAGVMVRDLAATVAGLGSDGAVWDRMVGTATRAFDRILPEVLQPVLHVPRHPFALARFGLDAFLPAHVQARRFARPQSQALFGGLAAHTFHRLDRPSSAAIALMLGAACHKVGWVVPKGGSRAISDALGRIVRAHGGRIETGVRVRTRADLSAHDFLVLNTSPRIAAEILGEALPARIARALLRYEHGPAAYKVDFAVHEGVPWTNPAARRAGTVHVGGTFAELAAAEREVVEGKLPARPFVLVTQQYLADPTRSRGTLHPVNCYAHVPHGYDGDASELVVAQIERFAPGFRARIASMVVTGPRALEAYNPNFHGGDIVGGANTPSQILFRPRLALDPYALGIDGVYLASASTPPGAGVHGMAGAHVATRILARLHLTTPRERADHALAQPHAPADRSRVVSAPPGA
jgi:phytoene dehydrogenase-like protein